MRMTDEQMEMLAEEIALSCEFEGDATVDVEGGFIKAQYRKGADIVCDETNYCTVSGAWCDIKSLTFHNEDLCKTERVECDIEAIENIVCEMTNN